MKSSSQSNKGPSSGSKVKKSSKDRERKKSQASGFEVNNHSTTEKGSPTKESNARLYAGIDADCVLNYAQQTSAEHLSKEITDILTEDINYRLRYIINEGLIKARLSGRNCINSSDIEHTFQNLRIGRVYGAPAHPSWLQFSPNLYCLDDQHVNLVEIAEEENAYVQYSSPLLTIQWLPYQKETSKALRNYFTVMCQMVVHNDADLRRMALLNIGESSRIGPIAEWFYNFGYILLSKDTTFYDGFTLRALDLIAVLESSRICRINVSERLLKLLARLMLQRLLKSLSAEALKPLCNALALLCLREPLKQFVIGKSLQKIDEVFYLAIITLANSLGVDAVERIVLPNVNLFLYRILEGQEVPLKCAIMESYRLMHKADLLDALIYGSFFEIFGESILFYAKADQSCAKNAQNVSFSKMKHNLIKTRRKIAAITSERRDINDVFEMPKANSRIAKKLHHHRRDKVCGERQVTVGRTSLLLPVFKQKRKAREKCCDHTVAAYNL